MLRRRRRGASSSHTRTAPCCTRNPISVSESFAADSVDGEISVDFKEAPPRTVEASTPHTVTSSIALPTPGPYLVHASGDSAQVRVPETTDPHGGGRSRPVDEGDAASRAPETGPDGTAEPVSSTQATDAMMSATGAALALRKPVPAHTLVAVRISCPHRRRAQRTGQIVDLGIAERRGASCSSMKRLRSPRAYRPEKPW